MGYDTSAGALAMREAEQRWSKLTIANDFVFCKAMLDPELCRDVLEVILGVPIERVEYVGRQAVLDTAPEDKSVRIDVYVRDAAGTVYDVEMQSTDTHELPRRVRYYQALMALDQISRGERYSRLKDAYVIFICRFDPFSRGQRVYCFENRCRNIPDLALGDGAQTVFLASSAPHQEDGGARLNELLDYVERGDVAGELSARLDAAVATVLDNEKWRLEYMLLEVRDQLNLDRGIEQGRAEGLEQGLRQGRAEGMASGIEQGRAEGEARLSRLVDMLFAQGRAEDVQRAMTDEAFRNALYVEFGVATGDA